ncbi:hypothetical protein Dda_1241 [Drechslerella dactyloides]|uniref:C2H2-type domain-containing protein n=1 Tax=Drechslerella dactyloides TaxID=74499 RepID=A0AAD6J1N0_DREDA|nr:hypothetical protein Dda_1241 [Drechslerella dactyloides]
MVSHERENHFVISTRSYQADVCGKHLITHKPAIHECYGKGCDRMFPTISGMFIHLESGTCPSKITLKDVNAVVAMYTHHNSIIHSDYNKSLAAMLNREDPPDGFPFHCPGFTPGSLCGKRFELFSGLLQHCESRACNHTFGQDDGGLLSFLHKVLYSESALFKLGRLKANVYSRIELVFPEVLRDGEQEHLEALLILLQMLFRKLLDIIENVQSRLKAAISKHINYQILGLSLGHPSNLDAITGRRGDLSALAGEYASITGNEGRIAGPERMNTSEVFVWNIDTGECQLLHLFLEETTAVFEILSLETQPQ